MFTLELTFINEDGEKARITVDFPRADLTVEEIEQAMDSIVAADVFTSKGGSFVSKDGARIIERNVTDFELSQ
ncbi:DUF2922 domain-containing protein [Sutcliffiella rhizosphaerae]|uniref:DUF2922 domain-containing protein n=1 Tax=Sutcliffiella rhizosphaerae TaxID=2880967 RepID=A0ABM8YMW3_9BACI|nr:DUF2922 domain-containing protein [Sutcliffiella rhizosphaerae]CAG9621202.1 hypothetical protein BACCIP111883_01974 [Sutcliffiella rhizosphaerae]